MIKTTAMASSRMPTGTNIPIIVEFLLLESLFSETSSLGGDLSARQGGREKHCIMQCV